MRARLDALDAGVRWPQPDARAVGEPQTTFLALLLRTFSPSRRQSGSGQHRRDAAIATAAILGGERRSLVTPAR